jgi:hypothetical protein
MQESLVSNLLRLIQTMKPPRKKKKGNLNRLIEGAVSVQ